MTTARNSNFCEENTKPAEQGSQHHLRDQDFYSALSDFLATSLHQRLKIRRKFQGVITLWQLQKRDLDLLIDSLYSGPAFVTEAKDLWTCLHLLLSRTFCVLKVICLAQSWPSCTFILLKKRIAKQNLNLVISSWTKKTRSHNT